MKERGTGYFGRLMAGLCHHCPICRFGRQNPASLIGRMLHHRVHADHCPFWKREREVYGTAKDED
ncbi:MAG: hypothetical protein KKE57_09605 [Proteobacteria bacterium]|nr:hypothetical protein [Pseudomonadota bacterium]